MELDPQVSQEEIMSREVELGCEKLDFFRFRFVLDSSETDIVFATLPSTAVETAIVQCTSRCTMVREHCLNTSIVLAAVQNRYMVIFFYADVRHQTTFATIFTQFC